MAVFQAKPSQKPHKNFYAYYRKDLTRIRYKRRKPPAVTIYRGNFAPKKFTGKEQDQETGLYYFGARYLDPKTSRWLSTDPALGDYLPVAPNSDDAKKHNQNLPGMGGVFNVVNLHVYHYAGNNPVKYVDPDGRDIGALTKLILKLFIGEKAFNEHFNDPVLDGFADISDKILHAAIEFPAIVVGEGADIVQMLAISTGNVPAATTAAGVGKVADITLLGSLLIKATNSGDSGDWADFEKQAVIMGVKTIVSWSVNKGFADIRVAQSTKNGGYYQKGHIGRLSNIEGMRKMLMQDLSPHMSAKYAEMLTNQVIDNIKRTDN